MILVGLQITIKKFWACTLSEKFQDIEFRILDIHPSREYSRGLLFVSGEEDLSTICEFIASLQGITQVEILLNEPDGKIISFSFQHGPLGEIIVKSGVHIRPPLYLENGVIKVNLIGTSSNIDSFFKHAEMLDDVSIEITRKSELKLLGKPRLTKRQEEILKAALRFGYYDLPRRITTAALAVKMNLSPATVAEHLRKVENKILKDYF
jgi:predicted DNA binding protein